MNIIANSCVGSDIITKILNERFENPFCWCVIDFDSMCTLIKDYEKIDFRKYILLRNGNICTIEIDGKVKVQYVHYMYDERYDAPTNIEGSADILYKKIDEYVEQKYIERLKRMQDKQEEPIFIFADSFEGLGRGDLTESQQRCLNELKNVSKYKIYYYASKKLNIINDNYKLATYIYKDLFTGDKNEFK